MSCTSPQLERRCLQPVRSMQDCFSGATTHGARKHLRSSTHAQMQALPPCACSADSVPMSTPCSWLGKRRLHAGGPLAPRPRWGLVHRADLLRGLAQQAQARAVRELLAALGPRPIPNPTHKGLGA